MAEHGITERSITLSLAAVDVLAELLDADMRQFPFQIPGLGEQLEDRVRIAGAVLVDLQKRGLVRSGRFIPEVERAFRLVTDYQVAIAVMGTVEEGRKIYARASTDGRDGVLVSKQDQIMRFDFIRPEGLVHGTVSLLSNMKAGPGQSVTISQRSGQPTTVAGDDGQPDLFAPVNAPRTSAEAQLRAAEVIMQRPRKGTGDFVVSAGGHPVLDPNAPGLTWVDTDAGRYTIRVTPGKDGQSWGTFAPADHARLMQQLGELVQAVR